MHTASLASFDVMFHVADEQGLPGGQRIFIEDLVDLLRFVFDAYVRLRDIIFDADPSGLIMISLAINRADNVYF